MLLAVAGAVGAGDEGFLDEQREGPAEGREDQAGVQAIRARVRECCEEGGQVRAARGSGGWRREGEENVALVRDRRGGGGGGADFQGHEGVESVSVVVSWLYGDMMGEDDILFVTGKPYGRIVAIAKFATDSIATVQEIAEVGGMKAARVVVAGPFD